MEDNGNKSYEELLKLVKHPKQRLFLERYPQLMVSAQVCESIGISKYTPYSWMYKDELFNKTFTTLKKTIDQDRLDKYEKELDKRILETPSKQSDILLMFGLKAGYPDKYREKPVQQLIAGNVTIKMDMPEEEIINVIQRPEETKELRQGADEKDPSG